MYFSLFSFAVLLNILLDFGITNYNNRNIARNPEDLKDAFTNIVGLKFLLAIFYAMVCLGVGLLIGYEKEQFRILWLLILNQFLASFLLYLRSNISGLHFFRTDSLISVMDRTLVIIICGFLLWGNLTRKTFQIEWFILSQTAAYSMTALTAFIIVLSKSKYFRLGIDLKKFATILKESYPFAILILLMMVYYRVDSVLLERILPQGKEQVGIYAQSFRILDAAYMFATLFVGLLFPIFSRMLKRNEPVEGMLGLSLTLILLPSILLSSIGIFYSREVIGLLYQEHLEASSRVFTILMIAFSAISVSHIFGSLLTANRNLKELIFLALTAVLLNLILNFILLPGYQAYGAAISCLVTQAYMALGQVAIAAWRLHLKVFLPFIFKICLSFPLILTGGVLTSRFLENWYAGILLLAVWTIIIAFSLRLVRMQDLVKLLPAGEE